MPKERHILLLSGGKDSTALALYMKQTRPHIPLEYVFCDTQKELPETYEYLAKVEGYLGTTVTRLSSSQDDRGFDHYLKLYGNYLPAPNMRWCTKKLKIEPFEQHLGEDAAFLYIGIRADERRDGYISTKENVTPLYPFKEDGITKSDVMRILEEAGIGLPEYYKWRTRSGCYFCFFQRRGEWVGLQEQHPELYQLAKKYEKPEEGFTWIQGESLADLEDPDRIRQIKQNEVTRKERDALNRRPQTLAEAFSGATDADYEDSPACLICHL